MAEPTPLRAPLAEDRAWQRRAFPYMTTGLAGMAIIFFAATILHFRSMQSWLAYTPPDIGTFVNGAAGGGPLDQSQREWAGRMALETHALNQRYRQNAAVVYTRVWNGYMGFLTGMVLALSGCVFILGKLREEVSFSGEASSAKWTLITSSPGIVLALCGAALVGLSLNVDVKVESEDRPVFLPQLVEIVGDTGRSVPAPKDLVPGGTTAGDSIVTRPLPATVCAKLPPGAPGCPPARSP